MKKSTPRKPSEIIQYYTNEYCKKRPSPDQFQTIANIIDGIIQYLDERAKLNNEEDKIMLP